MSIGTRVTHRRYTWMVGYVVGSPVLGVLSVLWDEKRDARDEYENELRPTPCQPFPRITEAASRYACG